VEQSSNATNQNIFLSCGVMVLVACLALSLVASAFAAYIAFW
jgi:hypothetical protein